MKKILYVGIVVSLIAACESSSEQSKSSDSSAKSEKMDEKELVSVIPNRKLTLEVDGMVCEMGCGGTIREELKSTGGVARCSFDFKGENVPSTATIEFDKDKISVDQIAKMIKQLNDGQFSVSKMSTETITAELSKPSNAQEVKSTAKTTVPVQMSESSGIQLPNFLGLLSELLIH
jgi:copper chaperone CopZ